MKLERSKYISIMISMHIPWYIEKTCEKLFDQWVLTLPRVLSPENAFPVECIFLAQRSAAWPYLERLSSDINL
jgi:hypothetical protein